MHPSTSTHPLRVRISHPTQVFDPDYGVILPFCLCLPGDDGKVYKVQIRLTSDYGLVYGCFQWQKDIPNSGCKVHIPRDLFHARVLGHGDDPLTRDDLLGPWKKTEVIAMVKQLGIGLDNATLKLFEQVTRKRPISNVGDFATQGVRRTAGTSPVRGGAFSSPGSSQAVAPSGDDVNDALEKVTDDNQALLIKIARLEGQLAKVTREAAQRASESRALHCEVASQRTHIELLEKGIIARAEKVKDLRSELRAKDAKIREMQEDDALWNAAV
ncbi:hypothetical protein OF83DRAFT_1177948 [Amylostereum chailletii]|nr:hypothetical protein OF83DRAFT_1177948 [Amylostereum chailletii]